MSENRQIVKSGSTITKQIANFAGKVKKTLNISFFDDIFYDKKEKPPAIAKIIYQDENIYFIFFFIALIAKLVKIDGKLNPIEEKAFLLEFSKLGYKMPNINNLFSAALEDKQDAEFYARKIKLLYNNKKEFFETLLAAMIRIAAVDAPINNLEMDFLKKIAAYFKVTPLAFGKLFSSVLATNPPRDPYLFLGVERDVSKAELNLVYRKLAKKFHPDNYVKYQDLAEEYKTILQDKFDLYTKAYTIIKNKLEK